MQPTSPAPTFGSYALIGHPIDQSPSPAMHNAAFAALQLPHRYTLRPASAADVAAVMEELRRGKWTGLNVTTPLKTLMAAEVQLDAVAARAGAVNTLWHGPRGEICGTLTDVEGVAVPLKNAGLKTGSHALVLGAGGAARAAVLALERSGVTVHVASREPQRAAHLLLELAPRECGTACALDDAATLSRLLSQIDVIVQATPVGRDSTAHRLPWHLARPGLIAFDMVYWPQQTPFLRDAATLASAACIAGWQMLLAQGARAFTIWTGLAAPEAAMQRAILEHLKTLPA